jgi:hypothetical protein
MKRCVFLLLAVLLSFLSLTTKASSQQFACYSITFTPPGCYVPQTACCGSPCAYNPPNTCNLACCLGCYIPKACQSTKPT